MADDREWIEQGLQHDGTRFFIGREQWQQHVAKRPEISEALRLAVTAMQQPECSLADPNRPDEQDRRFRLFSTSGAGAWSRHWLQVSAKYVRQKSGEWLKFYQSCWYERKR